MSQIKGPALFLGQFVQDVQPIQHVCLRNNPQARTDWAKEQVTKAVESSNLGSIWVDMQATRRELFFHESTFMPFDHMGRLF
jgi:hypothetical protein